MSTIFTLHALNQVLNSWHTSGAADQNDLADVGELKGEASAEDSDVASKSCGSCCETCPNKPQPQRVLYKEHLVELIGRRITGFATIPATLFLLVFFAIYATTTITKFGNVPTAELLAGTILVGVLFVAIAVMIINVIRALIRVDDIKVLLNEFFTPRLWVTPIIAIVSVIGSVFALVIATGDVTVAAKIESLLKEFYSPLCWSGVTLFVVVFPRMYSACGAYVGERLTGIEPAYQAWEACALPLSYSRIPKI